MEGEWTYDNRLETIREALETDGCVSHLMLLVAFGGIDEIKRQLNEQLQTGSLPRIVDLDPYYHHPGSVSVRSYINALFPSEPIRLIKFEGFYIEGHHRESGEIRLFLQQCRLLKELFSDYEDLFHYQPLTDNLAIARCPILNVWAHSTDQIFAIFPYAVLDLSKNTIDFVLLRTHRQMRIMSILQSEGSIDSRIWRRYDPEVTRNYDKVLIREMNRIKRRFDLAGIHDVILTSSERKDLLPGILNYSLQAKVSPRSDVISRWLIDHQYSYHLFLEQLENTAMCYFHVGDKHLTAYAFNIAEAIQLLKRNETDIPYTVYSQRPYLLTYLNGYEEVRVEITEYDFELFKLFTGSTYNPKHLIGSKRRILRENCARLKRRIERQGHPVLKGTGISKKGILYFPIVDIDQIPK